MADYIAGIDVSGWQGDIDWHKVASLRYRFAFIKSSEGVGYRDPKWDANWAGAKQAGLLRGPYHFARVSHSIATDARAEAQWMLDVVGPLAPGDLPPVLDIEWDKRAEGIPPGDIVHWCKVFLQHLETQTGRKPLVYTGPSFWRYRLGKTADLDSYPLWQVQYTTNPQPKPMGMWRWQFWQHTSKGAVPGIRGNVDLNRFSGSEAQLQALAQLAAHGNTELPVPSVPDPPAGLELPTVDLAQRGRSEIIERVQSLLLAHGLGPDGLIGHDGFPDGIAGLKTRQALQTFKAANCLPGDPHLVDRKTWWALISAGLD